MQYKKGTCFQCETPDVYLVKKTREGRLCHPCNEKRKAASKPPKKAYQYKRKPTGERVLFDVIFNTRPQVSCVSGESLASYKDTELYVNLFAHVIPKAKNRYPMFKLYDRNIALLTPQEHEQWDDRRWEVENDPRWQCMFALEEILKEEYAQLHPSKSIPLYIKH